jgi:hypothetical protein
MVVVGGNTNNGNKNARFFAGKYDPKSGSIV